MRGDKGWEGAYDIGMKLLCYPFNHPLPFAFLVSAGALGVALISQFGFGTYPCDLCIYQRIPYAAIAVLAGVGLLGNRHCEAHRSRRSVSESESAAATFKCWVRLPRRGGASPRNDGLLLLAVITLFFLVEAGLGWYHVSVEAGLMGSSCATQTGGGETLEELRAMIQGAPIVSCSDVGADFLGVSMALWNALAASGLGVIFILVIRVQSSEFRRDSA